MAMVLAASEMIGTALAATDSDSPEQTATSDRGIYQVTIRPRNDTVPVGELHEWVIRPQTAAGAGFVPTELVFMAGMPGHGHGTTSEPRVTEYLTDGSFLVEGVKFNMTGLWNIIVSVTGPAGPDRVVFELTVRNRPVDVPNAPTDWSEDELRALASLWLGSLGPVPNDPSNRLSGDPRAASLGQALFFDRRLSKGNDISCATCHDPKLLFTDGRPRSFGSRETARHSPGLLGVAYSKWQYWDGRRDSLWAQAVTPIETPGEMDSARVDVVRYVLTGDGYREPFGELSESLSTADMLDAKRFPEGAGPYASDEGRAAWSRMAAADQERINRAYSDIGKMLAAYVETLRVSPGRFDQFSEAMLGGQSDRATDILSKDEIAGLRLFIDADRTPCLRCHNGPLFTSHEFHNVGTGMAADESVDFGRWVGLRAALLDEFNCRGRFSDASEKQCDELGYATDTDTELGAFKVPGLRNVAETAPYMHDGRFTGLHDVLQHYRNPPNTDEMPSEILPFELNDQEAAQIVAFLSTLTGVASGADQ